MASLQRQVADSQSRHEKEKELEDRRRAALVLSIRFLVDEGLLDSAQRVQLESGVSLAKVDIADNIDLLSVIQQYSDFHQFKFGRWPKFYKRVERDGQEMSSRLPPVLSTKPTTTARRNRPKAPAKASVGESSRAMERARVQGTTLMVGNDNMETAAPSSSMDRLLKPMPPLTNDDDREMASIISKTIYLENPNVQWDEIAELGAAKTLLKEAIVLPIVYPSLFTGLLAPWKGILLHGPPGVGKTLLAKAIATDCRSTFFNVSIASIISKWRGDSEKLVRMLFELARHHAPSTIFIDELDSIMSSRGARTEHEASRRMKTELLIQMDGLATTDALVFVLAASNVPWDLDVAILRRLEKRWAQILVPLPNAIARAQIMRTHLTAARAPSIDIQRIAEQTDGFSGADVKLLCKEAAMRPLRRLFTELHQIGPDRRPNELVAPDIVDDDLAGALSCIKPSTDPTLVETYTRWQRQHGSSTTVMEPGEAPDI